MQNKKRQTVFTGCGAKFDVKRSFLFSCKPLCVAPDSQEILRNRSNGNALLVAETPKERIQSLKEYEKLRDQFRELVVDKL